MRKTLLTKFISVVIEFTFLGLFILLPSSQVMGSSQSLIQHIKINFSNTTHQNQFWDLANQNLSMNFFFQWFFKQMHMSFSVFFDCLPYLYQFWFICCFCIFLWHGVYAYTGCNKLLWRSRFFRWTSCVYSKPFWHGGSIRFHINNTINNITYKTGYLSS